MPELKAIHPQILVVPDPVIAVIGRVFILDKFRQKANSGVVFSSFPGAPVESGDKVSFNRRQAYDVIHENKEYLSIDFNYILTNNMKPLADRVILEPVKKDTSLSSGGIIVFDNPDIGVGVIKSVSEGTESCPMHLAPGDKVLYPKVGGTSLENVIIFSQKEIIAVV